MSGCEISHFFMHCVLWWSKWKNESFSFCPKKITLSIHNATRMQQLQISARVLNSLQKLESKDWTQRSQDNAQISQSKGNVIGFNHRINSPFRYLLKDFSSLPPSLFLKRTSMKNKQQSFGRAINFLLFHSLCHWHSRWPERTVSGFIKT